VENEPFYRHFRSANVAARAFGAILQDKMFSRQPPQLYRPHPDDQAEVAAALAEAKREEGVVTMTAEQFERWMTTGECDPWAGSSDSARRT
jgi:hypothetical protein